MTRLLGIVLIVSLAIGANVQDTRAVPQSRQALEHQVAHDEHRIRNLEHRRAFLHRFIQHLRHPVTTSYQRYSSGVLSAAQVASFAREAGFPESVIPTMVGFAYRESRFNPAAINATSGACGLWQIFPAQPGCTNPAANAAMAYAKYRAAGLSPWGG